MLESQRIRYWKLRLKALKKLGGYCVACGIDDVRVLQINHKLGDGKKDRGLGQSLLKAIVYGDLTKDFDIRCANCNILYEYELGRRELPIEVVVL